MLSLIKYYPQMCSGMWFYSLFFLYVDNCFGPISRNNVLPKEFHFSLNEYQLQQYYWWFFALCFKSLSKKFAVANFDFWGENLADTFGLSLENSNGWLSIIQQVGN